MLKEQIKNTLDKAEGFINDHFGVLAFALTTGAIGLMTYETIVGCKKSREEALQAYRTYLMVEAGKTKQ